VACQLRRPAIEIFKNPALSTEMHLPTIPTNFSTLVILEFSLKNTWSMEIQISRQKLEQIPALVSLDSSYIFWREIFIKLLGFGSPKKYSRKPPKQRLKQPNISFWEMYSK
jgi:hypothetical protein